MQKEEIMLHERNKQRESNFEFMRIFAMLLIIFNHLCQHGLWFPENSNLSLNFYISKCFYGWTGQLGNWLFILLSGYFVSQSTFSLKKIFRIWFQVFFISASIGLFFYFSKIPIIGFSNKDYQILGYFDAVKEASLLDLLYSFLPTLFGNNWFASAYILFYFFTPFLNQSLKYLDKKMHKNLIVLMTFFGTVVYMIYGQKFFDEGNLYYFILGYFIANYIRLYNPRFFYNQKRNIILSLLCVLSFILWILFVITFREKITFIDSHFKEVFSYPFGLTRFPMLLCSVFIFCTFRNFKIKNNKIINILASTTFGVYLIHENHLLNKVIWHVVFRFDSFLESKFLFIYMIAATIIVFVSCSILDLIRQKFIEQPIIRILFNHR